ncbi:CG6912, partial [Drosophila busckii]
NPCPNQPVTPYPNLVPQSTPATSVETTPNPNLVPQSTPETATDTQTSQPDAELVPQSTPPGATTESTAMSPTTVATTNEPRPEPITQCPKGTILVGGKCHLVYCGVYELSDEHCARLQCPAGTIWTGQKCARPAPIEIEPIHLERTITVVNDKNEPNLVLNNVHNLVINASISLTPAESEYEDESEEAAAEPAAKCCTVLGPRTCRYDAQSSRWQCFNRKQNQCGDFCSAPKVMLIPATVTTWSYNNAQMLVMPPPPNNVVTGINNSSYDCSGCAAGALMSCSPYCYNSACSSPYCAYYAQAQFCQTQAVGSVGCCPEDGWPVSSSEPKD